MGIQNGSAPESGATDWMTKFTMERDSLQVQLQESERLRAEAFQACEATRQELVALQAQLEAAKNEASKTGWVLVGSHLPNREQLDTEIVRLTNNLTRETDERKALQQQVAELQAQLEAVRETAENNYMKWQQEAVKCKAIQGQGSELQAQLETAAVTPVQQPDDNAVEQLERVRRMIGEIRGWYACVECLGEQSAETWEQVGALLGHLQGEAD